MKRMFALMMVMLFMFSTATATYVSAGSKRETFSVGKQQGWNPRV